MMSNLMQQLLEQTQLVARYIVFVLVLVLLEDRSAHTVREQHNL